MDARRLFTVTLTALLLALTATLPGRAGSVQGSWAQLSAGEAQAGPVRFGALRLFATGQVCDDWLSGSGGDDDLSLAGPATILPPPWAGVSVVAATPRVLHLSSFGLPAGPRQPTGPPSSALNV